MQITSKSNAKVKQWVKYQQKKYRMQDQRFLIEGYHLLEEAYHTGILEAIIVEEGYNQPYSEIETYEVTSEIMEKLTMHSSREHIIGVCIMWESKFDCNWKKVALLDDVQDPGNIGTIIRSAHSFGFDAVVLSKHSVDLFHEKLIRSTQGAIFHIPVMQMELSEVITSLKKEGVPVYATALRDALPLSSYEADNVALVFGNEGNGVSKEILDCCDGNIIIEMSAFESLNVAVAAGITMYHFRKK